MSCHIYQPDGALLSDSERICDVYGLRYRAAHRPRSIALERAAALYERLGRYLRVIRPWGCCLPPRKGLPVRRVVLHRLGDYPLAFRREMYPVIVVWDPGASSARRPSFDEFLAAYNLQITDSEMRTL